MFEVFRLAGGAMSAQSVRLNTTASNLANADSVSSSLEETYKARFPVFNTVELEGDSGLVGVEVSDVFEQELPAVARYQPGHPKADSAGYVFSPNVNVIEEMANMMSASRSYERQIEMLNTVKDLLQRTLRLGA